MVAMRTTEYEIMANAEDKYWWHIGRESIIDGQLTQISKGRHLKILNVGCGTGGTVPMLERHGAVTNIDTSEEAIRIAKRRGVNNVQLVNGFDVPFKDSSFDVIVALDVLEHISDDHSALREWGRVLKDGGAIVLTVPAYQWLWSQHDEVLHHFRRYNASGLHKLFNTAGLKVIKRSYIIASTLIPIVAYRFLASLLPKKDEGATSYVELPTWINSMLAWILKLEGKCLSLFNFPAGTSILMIGKK